MSLHHVAVPSSRLATVLLLLFAAGLVAAPATAQPFGQFLQLSGPTSGYVEIPSSSALNPTSAITLEAWVRVTDPGGCSSILGKNYQQAWWVGICGTTLRSYLRGTSSLKDGGTLLPGEWHHIAVVFDGAHRFHYIDGEQTLSVAESAPLTTTSDPFRIGSDVVYPHTPNGLIDEVRLWNVGRTQDQIRAGMQGLAGPAAGLVALWPLNNNFTDVVGGHNGTAHGTTTFALFGTGSSCTGAASSTDLCLLTRFLVNVKFRTGAQGSAEGAAHLVSFADPGSGIFWFFDLHNWEVMVKTINACSLNNSYWVFSAATTNVFYRMEVFDYPTGTQRIYFNYPGPPAPAVTDVNAFATCP